MIKEKITVDEVLEVLNSAATMDREAMENLLAARVNCNKELADHPTIQVALKSYCVAEKVNKYHVGILGLLNGLFGISETGFGIITANYEVLCPSGCKSSEDNPMKAVGDKCKHCNRALILGKLIDFCRVPNAYLYK